MKHVSIIVIPKALGSTITIPLEMLSAANDVAKARRQHDKLISINLISGIDKTELELSGRLILNCTSTIYDVTSSDLIFIPGIWGNPKASMKNLTHLQKWLVDRYDYGSILCSIVNGSFFLAESGLLNGKLATTHWRFFDEFEQRYPEVTLLRERFITRDENLFCTGSVNAVRDLMLYFIERLFGDSIANEVARHFTHELKRSYESLLLNEDQQRSHHDEEIIKLQEWLENNYQTAVAIPELASKFKLSVRSLNRRFRSATNSTPLRYLQNLRIDKAQELLKESNLAVSEVADFVGYQDASHFSSLFKKANGLGPSEYRNLVRKKLFLAGKSEQK